MCNYQETRLSFRSERLKEGMTKSQAASSPECYKLGENLREREKQWAKEYSNTPIPNDYNYSTIPSFYDDDDDPIWD